MIPTNEFQTQLTDELLDSLNVDVRDELLEYINSVPYIQRLISPDRKRAKDLERRDGRIIVDLANPHILEDMDYFRQSIIYFQKHGVYTKLKPSSRPNSEYMLWLRQEVDRCWDGMVRESDGEWIPGTLYFYLNYTPMKVSKDIDGATYHVDEFPGMWEGVYLRAHYHHQAKYGGLYNDWKGKNHCAEIASRGCSKSYYCAAIVSKNFLLGESSKNTKKVKSIVCAYSREFLMKDGILNKFIDTLSHCAFHTPFPSLKCKDLPSGMEWRSGYEDDQTGNIRGSQNEVLGVSIKDDVGKARGKRSATQINEEFGMFPKFMDFYQTCLPNVQEGTKAFGQSISIGTGGSENSDFSGALELIQNPSGYNVYGIPNYYDKGSSGVKKTIFFFPGYMNRVGFYNHDGVSDVTGAMIDEIKYRVDLKYNSSDPIMLTRRRAETAYTLQDAVMKRDGSLFPSSQLNDRINELDLDPNAYSGMWSGRLTVIDGVVCYKPDSDLVVIKDFPHKNNKLEGAIHICAMPEKDSTGNVPSGRYIAGADVYDDDTSNTMSLGSIYIMDLWTDDLVFEYTGRPMYADDFYEICRLGCIFYNAELNYENNKKGLFKYFSQHNSLYLLSDTLDFLKDKEQYKITTITNKTKGTGNYGSGTNAVAPYARRCIRDYLLRECEITRKRTLPDGKIEVEDINVMKLHTIKYRALLKELAMWCDDMNTDRVDALAMLMLLREDRLRLAGDKNVKDAYSQDPNYLGNDDFFNKNYKEKRHSTYM